MKFCLPIKAIPALAACLLMPFAAMPAEAYEDVLVTEEIEGQLEKSPPQRDI